MDEAADSQGALVMVARLEDLRPGFASVHEVEGRSLVVTRTEDEVTVWDATCPHADFQFGPMRLARGCELECPMHGARFHVTDGRVLKGPATDGLEPITSRVDGDRVMVLVDWLI